MTPKESLDGIIAGLRCGICPEGKMRENPCHVCVGKYAAIERVRVLFAVALNELDFCSDPSTVGKLERALRGGT